mgnify:FL=1
MNIYEYTQGQITSYPSREIELYGTRQFNQYDLLNKIAAYTDSHYTSGEFDDLGRRKPFYNISNRILHKQRTAEDIDTKDIVLTTTKPAHYAKSLLMTVANRKWMKMVNFPLTLNQMTEVRGRDGGLLVKKVMSEGQLNIEVADMLTTITDPTDIASGSKVQESKYNASELMEMKKNGWENVEDAIMMHEASNSNDSPNEEGNNPGTDYITVYVVDGVLPRTMIDDTAEMFEYSRQMHVITLFSTTDDDGNDEDTGITLYSSENTKDNYKYLSYEKMSGRSLGRGMVEQTFQAQMGINETVINEKNAMDVASKVLLMQPNGNGTDTNSNLNDYHDGAIFEYNIAAPQLLNTTPQSLGFHGAMREDWNTQANNQSSVQDVNTGNMPASATFRGMALQNQEANSIFELRREEMGIFLQEIYRDWIIPHLTKWVKKQEFMEAELTSEEMQQVVEDYSFNQARNTVDKRYFAGKYEGLEPGMKFAQMGLDQELEANAIKEDLRSEGKNWMKSDSNYLDGIEYDLDILITDEQQLKQVFLSNQVDILNTYLANREAFAQDPNAMKQYNAIQQTMGLQPLQAIDAPVETSQEVSQPASSPANINVEQ